MKSLIIIVIFFISLSISFNSKAQVLSNQSILNGVTNENPFLDVSSNFYDLNDNRGKGLLFPQTDLTKFTFRTGSLDGLTMPTAFDGMIVFNVGTGPTPIGQGVLSTNVTPGFYYFRNPNADGLDIATMGEGTSNIVGAQWVRLSNNLDLISNTASVSAAPPTPAILGMVYFNTTDNKFYKCTAVGPDTWEAVSTGGSGSSVTVSATAPATGSVGDMYFNTDEGKLYVSKDNGPTWVSVSDPHLTFGSGLTRTNNVIASDLFTGKGSSQTVIGGTIAGGTLTLQSTSHATRGKVFFGTSQTSVYNEANDRLGIGTASPTAPLDVVGNIVGRGDVTIRGGDLTIGFGTTAKAGAIVFHDASTGSNTTTLQSYAGNLGIPSSFTLTLPADGGTNGQVLQTDGSGNLSWTNSGTEDAETDGSTKGIAAFKTSDFDDDGEGVISLDYANGLKASGTATGFLSSTDWNTFHGKESALTFGTGLTRTTNTITSNLSVGFAGGQSVIGGTDANEILTLKSTSNATKGKIIFGSSTYDELNNRLGIGTTTPTEALDVNGNIAASGNVTAIGDATIRGGDLTLGLATTAKAATIVFHDNDATDSFTTTLRSNADVSNSFTLTLPADGGTSGQVLQTDGSGNLSWTAGSADGVQSITISGDVAGTGTTAITATLSDNAVKTSKIDDNAVTLGKMAPLGAGKLIGNPMATSGTPSEISIGAGLTLASDGTLSSTGSGGTVTSVTSATTNQLTVVNGSGSPSLSIVTGAVSDGGTALATGDQIYDFVAGKGYLSGTSVPVSGDILAGDDGTLTIQDNKVTTAKIAPNAISYNKMQQVAPTRLLGNPLASASAPSEISIGTGLSLATDGTLSASVTAELDPVVKAVSGLVKSNGSTISAAIAGTDYLMPTGSAASLTNFPVLNQNTTGNAATATKLAATKTINGVAFDGSANITIPETDAVVKAVNGLVKSNGSTISAAIAGTDYLTSNQSVTISGDVMGTGTTNITATLSDNAVKTSKIADNTVTLGKMAPLGAGKLIGNPSASSGTPSEISIGAGLTLASDGTLSSTVAGLPPIDGDDANKLLKVNSSLLAEWDTPVEVSGDLEASEEGALTIKPGKVLLNKMAPLSSSSKLLGSGDSGSGNTVQELSLGSGLSLNGTTLNVTASQGTVTSVGLALPGIFTVSASPVTASGDLSAVLADQQAYTVFAAPAGSAGQPAFRQLDATDIPSLDWSIITSGKPATLSGYGITDALPLSGGTLTGKLNTAGINLQYNLVPTIPANGDLWTTTSGVYAQISGATVAVGMPPIVAADANKLLKVNSSGSTAGWEAPVVVTGDLQAENDGKLIIKQDVVTSAHIINGTIVNADISPSAAIAGTKINADFGTQAIKTTSTVSGSSFVSLSDRRLKQNIQTLAGVMDKINGLRGVRFEFIDQNKYAKGPQIGLIAQELQQVYPELVMTGDDGFLQVNYSQLSAVLIQGINEMNARIDHLEQRIQDQETRLDEQQKQIEQIQKIVQKLAQ